MAREAPRIVLSPYEFLDLRRLANAHSTPQGLAFRARLVLRCASADKPTNDQVASEFGWIPDTVSKWRRRFRAAIGSRAFPTFPAAAARPLFPRRTATRSLSWPPPAPLTWASPPRTGRWTIWPTTS